MTSKPKIMSLIFRWLPEIVMDRNGITCKGLSYHSNKKCIGLTKSSTHAYIYNSMYGKLYP